ncbi:hypothetical protein K443DRAFT_683509 [Laccaria amethystina LaAM-08-1]|uniref:Uncharacterized protein n=1 Tax=Laccaria amethystina LaAM-08-1 TaxID=1095629 RepID=A0A0C9WJI8_9AGAR|nr:hypothetical protein K443DRAFT_683509 [Laccaria amethystina LaAM-08-1]
MPFFGLSSSSIYKSSRTIIILSSQYSSSEKVSHSNRLGDVELILQCFSLTSFQLFIRWRMQLVSEKLRRGCDWREQLFRYANIIRGGFAVLNMASYVTSCSTKVPVQ